MEENEFFMCNSALKNISENSEKKKDQNLLKTTAFNCYIWVGLLEQKKKKENFF